MPSSYLCVARTRISTPYSSRIVPPYVRLDEPASNLMTNDPHAERIAGAIDRFVEQHTGRYNMSIHTVPY
jgi:hypothetical protein